MVTEYKNLTYLKISIFAFGTFTNFDGMILFAFLSESVEDFNDY